MFAPALAAPCDIRLLSTVTQHDYVVGGIMALVNRRMNSHVWRSKTLRRDVLPYEQTSQQRSASFDCRATCECSLQMLQGDISFNHQSIFVHVGYGASWRSDNASHWGFVVTSSSKYYKFITYYVYRRSLDGATLLSKVDSKKLPGYVKSEMALICAKFGADLINTSNVTSRKTKWPRFWPTLYVAVSLVQLVATRLVTRRRVSDVMIMLSGRHYLFHLV